VDLNTFVIDLHSFFKQRLIEKCFFFRIIQAIIKIYLAWEKFSDLWPV